MTAAGWLRTGGLGVIDELGRLRITGRAKEQFKTSKGKYVAPAPIENLLGANSRIEAVCVAGADYAQPFALLMLPAELSAATTRDPVLRAERSEEHTSELQSLMRISYAVFCLKKKI